MHVYMNVKFTHLFINKIIIQQQIKLIAKFLSMLL